MLTSQSQEQLIEIMCKDLYNLIEGCLLSGFAMRAHASYIYIHREYFNKSVVFDEAIHHAYSTGYIIENA
eukprot:3671439-Ditylum_brightwellii.AAC.1